MTQLITEPFFKRVLKDPLFHFLILGGLLFTAVSLWGNQTRPQGEIIITRASQQHLADLFTLTWQREPTPDELKNLVQEHIKEEVYYREALALGLDDNDTIVRRRLRQKLEFMQEDLSSLQTPSEPELKTYYIAHKDEYKTDHIMSFKQIVISPKTLMPNANEIERALGMLNKGAPPQRLSRSSLLPVSMNLETAKSIKNTFGLDFLDSISALKPNKWGGPIHSGFGTHLVYISLNQKPKPLTFTQAQHKLSADYTQFKREAAAKTYYKNLRRQYQITIENSHD